MEDASRPISVHLDRVSKSFPRGRGRLDVLCDIDMEVPAGRFVTILGPSGSGKSTLLGILAGLDEPDSGIINLWREGATGTVEHRLGRVGYMPQRDLLLPWRTALDNATVGLEVQGVPQQEARARAIPLFAEFGLEGFAENYPNELSGGMRQRVSFLRSALVAHGLMLLDEPFGALDALTRAAMQEWLLQSVVRLNTTFVLVTHDVDEAVLLSDRVYVLSPRPGKLVGMEEIELPRPRSLDSASDERFAAYRHRLLEMLRETGGLAAAGEAR
ncbi:MAG TPA: ABC transporter ATP-binding protein [Chloroflexia bacterium]|nr:ABC transporter ATP-binding protein [Chloroflexia bacterium]